MRNPCCFWVHPKSTRSSGRDTLWRVGVVVSECPTERPEPARLEWRKEWKQQQQIGHSEQRGGTVMALNQAQNWHLGRTWEDAGWWKRGFSSFEEDRCSHELQSRGIYRSGSYICSHFYISLVFLWPIQASETSKQCQVFKGGLVFNMGVVLVFAFAVI